MGIQDLQDFIESHCAEACKPVDLVQVARGVASSKAAKRRGGRLRLVVDAESCLDRLYGGFYSDWACGGQWNRMTNFLTNLLNACHAANLDLVVYINGALERERRQQWYTQQIALRKNINLVLRHVNIKGTPPPKIWWIPPSCLETTLRMALRAFGIPMAVSMDDHHQEVIAYCREHGFHGILAQDADFAIFDPPRYFSSENLKLTYRGGLETKEYVMDEVAKVIDLHPKRFCVLAALLGTHLLPVSDLQVFYCKICKRSVPSEMSKVSPTDIVRAVITYVRSIDSVDNLDEVGQGVFQDCLGNVEDKMARFKQSVHYYLNGTKEGFLKYLPKKKHGGAACAVTQPGSYPSKGGKKPAAAATGGSPAPSKKPDKPVKKEQSDDAEEGTEFKADAVYTEAESGYGADSLAAPEIVIDPPSTAGADAQDDLIAAIAEEMKPLRIDEGEAKEVPPEAENKPKAPKNDKKENKDKGSKNNSGSKKKSENSRGLVVPHNVMQVACDRHQKGLMHPWVYQIFSQGEIKIGLGLEDEIHRELPTAADLYRPMRQHVYSILFDLSKQLAEYNKKKKEKSDKKPEKPRIAIKEWMIPKASSNASAPRCDTVYAEPVDWLVSGIQRLWMGPTPDDKNRRLRAFMSCMHADMPQNLLMNTSYVPQHLLLMCCVLRYMIVYRHEPVLRRQELDAFLATAVSPMLQEVEVVQEMKLPMITSRGVQLAALFMRGVDHAIFVNDAVGAPIPWNCCCPWLFFDGKLFHFKLLKANNNTALIDICDGHAEQVMRVERMRQAILQGRPLDQVFAKPTLHNMAAMGGGGGSQYQHMYQGYDFIPAGMESRQHHHHQQQAQQQQAFGAAQGMAMGRGTGGRGRGLLGQGPVDGRGGQLQIAGVVVGNWGGTNQIQPLMQDEMPVPGDFGGRRRGRGRGAHLASMAQGPSMVMAPAQQNRRVVSSRARGQGNRAGASRGQMTGSRSGYQSRNQSAPVGGKGKGRGQGRAGGGRGQDITKVTLEQRSKPQSGGRGRGCTVETPTDEGSVMTVSALMKNEGGMVGISNDDIYNSDDNADDTIHNGYHGNVMDFVE